MLLEDFISKNDKNELYSILKNSWMQIEYANSLNLNLKSKDFQNIIICGLGGSAIAGEIFPSLFKDEISCPIFINRNYHLPNFANEKTLAILSSYSGNTEETISAFEDAKKKNCQIICVGSGGTLFELAKENNCDFIVLPAGFQPRFALYVSLFSLLKIFENLNIIKEQKNFFEQAKDLLKEKSEDYSKENSIAFNVAKNLIGFVPIIYGSADSTYSIAIRFKGQINENSKLHAFCSAFPELNHNEIVGWESFDQKLLNAKIIYLKEITDYTRNLLRMKLTSEILKTKGVEIIELESAEKNYKLRIIDLIYLCDWISYHLAAIRNYDPGEIDFIIRLKNLMSKN